MKSIQVQMPMTQMQGVPLCSLIRIGTRDSPGREVLTLLGRTVRPPRSCLAGCIRSAFVAEAESIGLGSYPEST